MASCPGGVAPRGSAQALVDACANASASGIKQVSDFAGTYSSVGGGGAFVGGAGGVQLGNEKGVTIALRGGRAGMEFAGNVSQVVISLKGR